MLQHVLADDEAEAPPLERRIQFGEIRADIGDPVDIGAGFDVEADELRGRKQLAPAPRRPIDDCLLAADLQDRRLGERAHALHLFMCRRADDFDARLLHEAILAWRPVQARPWRDGGLS
jgi:hypothetical protein